MRARVTLAGGAALLVALAVTAAVLVPHDPAALRELARAAGPWAPLGLLVCWVAGTPMMVPANLLCAAGGLLLGPLGVAVGLLGSPLGALAAFVLARLVGGRLHLGDHLPARLQRLVGHLERSGARGVAVVRIAPGVPGGAFNYAAGLTRLRHHHFFLGTALGTAPRVVLYGALGGAVATAGPAVLLVGSAVSLGGLAVWRLTRRGAPALAL